jgi:predicted nucleotidyltransferase
MRLSTTLRKADRSKAMRLTPETRQIIKQQAAELLGTDCEVRLFGSRLDDDQRGGDIDLLVATPHVVKNRVALECRLAARLYLRLGGRKVDVLIKDSASPDRPIDRQAMQHGVVL